MRSRLAWALLGCLLMPVGGAAATVEISFAAGIWCNREKEHKVSDAHEDELVRSLRRITGLKGLSFAEDGSLSLGEITEVESGSSTARQIIFSALKSGKTFIIEDHSRSQSVIFGQMDEGTDFEDIVSRRKQDIWRLRIDFEDFHEIDASADVRNSFDAGFTVLHELLHGLGYKDGNTKDELGALEGLVNEARAELGLPQRDLYFGEPIRITAQISTVRLRFRKQNNQIAESQRQRTSRRMDYLYFLLPAGYRGLQSQNGLIRFSCVSRQK
jgi:hypothetical protein